MSCCTMTKFQLIRYLVILTSILTLIQGAFYLALSIWSMLVHKCLRIPSHSDLEKVVYFIYFRDHECGEVIWSQQKPDVFPIMPKVTTIATRTFYIFLCYAIISSLWIISSLMVLGAFCSNVNRRAYRVCFQPWLVFILLGSVLDVIATVFFVNDIFYTETVDKALDYLSVKNTAEMRSVLTNYEEFFIYAAVRMSLISSRCILLWFYNVIAVSFAVKLTKYVVQTNEINDKTPQISVTQPFDSDTEQRRNGQQTKPHQNRTSEKRTFEPLKNGSGGGEAIVRQLSQSPQMTQTTSPKSRSSRAIRAAEDEEQHQQSKHPRELSREHSREQQQTRELSREQSLLSNRRVDNVRDYSDINDSPFQITRRNLQPYHLQYHDNNNSVSLIGGGGSPQSSPVPRSPSYRDSYNAYRNSQINRDSLESNESEIRKPEKRNINAELRGQLPWSYFGPPSDIKAPKHALQHLPNSPAASSPIDEKQQHHYNNNDHQDQQHDLLPPIPVPDYTLHFPKDDRPSMKNYNMNGQQYSTVQKQPSSPLRNSHHHKW